MSDIARIRKLYPHPVRMGSDEYYTRPSHARFCVGGAVCRFYRLHETHQYISASGECFPDKVTLAEALEDLNPLLGEDRAHAFARRIIDHNDSDDFEAAWQLADRALDWRPGKEVPA